MAKKKRKSSIPAKFQVGDKVRVKHGIKDVEYPDMPLGGWAGTITEVHKDGMYTIRWSAETLAAIHPVVKKRSEKDGTVLEEYWLGDDDLEPDSGGPLAIEHPTQITTKPLSPEDQDDRIRAIFGLTSNDPLPYVCDETLLSYYKHLTENLRFPFKVDHFVETGRFERRKKSVTVLGLLDPATDPPDETEGLICEARLGRDVIEMPLAEFEVDEDASGLQVLADYCYWFWNSGAEPDDDEAGPTTRRFHEGPPRFCSTPSAFSRWGIRRSGRQVRDTRSVLWRRGWSGVEGHNRSGLGCLDWREYFGRSRCDSRNAVRTLLRSPQPDHVRPALRRNNRRGGRWAPWSFCRSGRNRLDGSHSWSGHRVSGRAAPPQRRVRPLSTFSWAVAGAGIGTCILAFRRDHAMAAEGMIYGGTIGAAAGSDSFSGIGPFAQPFAERKKSVMA